MKILVVDDNTSITDSLEKYLKLKKFDVKVCNNGKDALENIINNHWDKILMDLSMPEFSGINIISTLEEKGILKDKNIILFTASSIPDQKLEELLTKEGVKKCIKKPIKLTKIVETLTA